MYKVEVERNALKVMFQEQYTAMPTNQSVLHDDVDLMPIVRLLSLVGREDAADETLKDAV